MGTPVIKYVQTGQTPIFGTPVTKSGQMDKKGYFYETSKALSGDASIFSSKYSDISDAQGKFSNMFGLSDKEFDQDSINATMWAAGDANNDGYIDEEEYKNLYYFATTGVVNVPLFGKTLTQEQAEALNSLYEADKGIDGNGDSVLSRDEFNNAAVNYILTDPERIKKDESTPAFNN